MPKQLRTLVEDQTHLGVKGMVVSIAEPLIIYLSNTNSTIFTKVEHISCTGYETRSTLVRDCSIILCFSCPNTKPRCWAVTSFCMQFGT